MRPFDDAVVRLVEVGSGVETSGRTHIIPSMLQDVLAGKKTEIDETVGYVCHEGRAARHSGAVHRVRLPQRQGD